ncbi:succinylglutamate desuccinylase/aspartoacylase family protein [Halalkalicoccus sp. NIPERK01]|uniref:M99 family carboxypeptidase catalytic domain-containing protein n=1 Tax=Halalkalicoccus sp. NIPERK01 TaxID=3053469 RepID=UPI00256EA8DD|nr:succinylglutamate desuccinylase/aspartoacylase family protein [Halalkalicoccus sp. NIPERK01]MDL5363326.1 succinylglutamate desuccinylase/aspartoacylase family protein [Halalkalicoccus sp. NIPERK01]
MAGTDRETGVYEVDGSAEGPTAVLIGGMHGNEINGYRVAAAATDWGIDAGRLVVVPLANIVAIERNAREGPGGDLNRQFPGGRDLETDLARAIWGVVEDADPDVVIDLHRSRGLFETHPRWVGQAIFPTRAGGAVEDAEHVIDAMNDRYVPSTMRFHRFAMGNVQDDDRDSGLLVQKVHLELGVAGFLAELTEFLLDLETQLRWTTAITELLLERHGIRRIA